MVTGESISKEVKKWADSPVKGKLGECNMTAHKEESSETRTWKIPINLDGRRITAIIDSGATGNFASKKI